MTFSAIVDLPINSTTREDNHLVIGFNAKVEVQMAIVFIQIFLSNHQRELKSSYLPLTLLK